ncbi:MAG: lysostaphin resistance A-like protein [Bacteroidia bacterium]
MLGIFVIILLSGVLLYWLEKDPIKAFGFKPVYKRLGQFFAGFGFLLLFHLMMIGLDTISQSIDWDLNPNFSYQLAAETVWYHLKSALTEELIFRGALLYLLIKKLGLQAGLIISSVAFGVYHWFSYGAWGALVPMIYVFIATASMGYVWAWAFARTRSIMLGLGMHLGWNLMGAIFSTGPSGDLLFIEQSRLAFSDWNNLWYLLGKGLAVPILTILLLSYFWPPQNPTPQVEPLLGKIDSE